MTRIGLLTALGLAAGLALAGCSTQGTPTAGTTTTSASGPATTGPSDTGSVTATQTATEAPPSTPGGPVRCSPALLSGTVQPKDSAAGNRYAELVVTNTGKAACTLYGYGGLQLLDGSGNALPTTALRDEPPKPALVNVAPGAHAAKLLHWTVVPTGDEPADKPCQPPPAKLSIIPPDETQPFVVAWDLGPVCGHGTFHGSAYYKA